MAPRPPKTPPRWPQDHPRTHPDLRRARPNKLKSTQRRPEIVSTKIPPCSPALSPSQFSFLFFAFLSWLFSHVAFLFFSLFSPLCSCFPPLLSSLLLEYLLFSCLRFLHFLHSLLFPPLAVSSRPVSLRPPLILLLASLFALLSDLLLIILSSLFPLSFSSPLLLSPLLSLLSSVFSLLLSSCSFLFSSFFSVLSPRFSVLSSLLSLLLSGRP